MSVLGIIPPGRRLRILRRPPESILPSTPRPARRDCHGRLTSALLALAGEHTTVADSSLRPWHSATFVGSWHDISLTIGGEDSEARAAEFMEKLPAAELRLPGHIVADMKAEAMDRSPGECTTMRIAVLTIEAW